MAQNKLRKKAEYTGRGGKSAVAWQPSCQKIFRIGRKFWAS